MRGWDNGRGVDAARVFGGNQLDALQNITGTVGNIQFVWGPTCVASGAFDYGVSSPAGLSTTAAYGGGENAVPVTFDASRVARTSTETRPRNVALMPCIKY